MFSSRWRMAWGEQTGGKVTLWRRQHWLRRRNGVIQLANRTQTSEDCPSTLARSEQAADKSWCGIGLERHHRTRSDVRDQKVSVYRTSNKRCAVRIVRFHICDSPVLSRRLFKTFFSLLDSIWLFRLILGGQLWCSLPVYFVITLSWEIILSLRRMAADFSTWNLADQIAELTTELWTESRSTFPRSARLYSVEDCSAIKATSYLYRRKVNCRYEIISGWNRSHKQLGQSVVCGLF